MSSIVDDLETALESGGTRPAVIDDGLTYSYNELRPFVESCLNCLTSYTDPGDPVAMVMGNSVEMVAVVWAVFASRRILLPFDREAPIDEVKVMLATTQPKFLFSDSDIESELLEQLSIFSLNEIEIREIEQPGEGTIDHEINGEDLALIMVRIDDDEFEGVKINHQLLANLAKTMTTDFSFEYRDIFLFNTPLNDVRAYWEIVCAFTNQATLLLVPTKKRFNAEVCADLTVTHVATSAHCRTQFLGDFVNELELANKDFELFTLFVSGDHCLATTFENAYDRIAKEITYLYGPVEVGGVASYYRYAGETQLSEWYVPLGMPITDLDAESDLKGQLLLTGEQVGMGYYDAEKTFEQFFVTETPTERGFRTGLRVEFKEIDSETQLVELPALLQVGGREMMVEDVIDAVLMLPKVTDCHLFADRGRLCLAVSPELDVKLLRNLLTEKLLQTHIPSKIVSFSFLPTTADCRIDYEMIETAAGYLNHGYDSALEMKIANAVCTLLDRPAGTIDPNGSLRGMVTEEEAIEVCDLLRSRYKLDIYPGNVYDPDTSFHQLVGMTKQLYSPQRPMSVLELQLRLENFVDEDESGLIVIEARPTEMYISPEELAKVLNSIAESYPTKTFLLAEFSTSYITHQEYHDIHSLSDSQTGSYLREDHKWQQIPHPVLGWAVTGPEVELLLEADRHSCFGDNSIFAYFEQRNASYWLLDQDSCALLTYFREQTSVATRYTYGRVTVGPVTTQGYALSYRSKVDELFGTMGSYQDREIDGFAHVVWLDSAELRWFSTYTFKKCLFPELCDSEGEVETTPS